LAESIPPGVSEPVGLPPTSGEILSATFLIAGMDTAF